MSYSKGNWSIGKNCGVVVTDNGEGFPTNSGHDATDFYGGYLIAESIAKEADAKLIAAAPDLLAALIVAEEAMAYEEGTVESEGIKQVRAAIKKATQ